MNKQQSMPPALPYDGPGRPQILVIGNGLERMDDKGVDRPENLKDAGKSWNDLVDELTVPDHIPLQKGDLDAIPFPLKYHLLSSGQDVPYPMREENRSAEQTRLAEAVRGLDTVSNPALRRLPELGADHIFTTNYTYSLEKAFHPKKNMRNEKTRRALRFNYNPERTETGKRKLEKYYRCYTGYLAKNKDGSQVNLWHIHGECSAAGSIILGHDGYGRLLSRIVPVCGDWQKYHDLKPGKPYAFASWPELFLFGDVYIVGLGMGISEFDLWWLLRRKQREEQGTGRVYFYTNDRENDYRDRDLMLKALGVAVNPAGLARRADYNSFYKEAMEDISDRIAENRRQREAAFAG